MNRDRLDKYVDLMAGHPAYIKWFVSGIQAGSRPEDLVNHNGLLLDFCMSNVYEFLDDHAKGVLQCMQVLAGPKNQAELAYLGDYSAQDIQAALLGLLRTNFVSMTHSQDESYDTSYRLSDFAKQYLDKHHSVAAPKRKELKRRSEDLREWGADLGAEIARSPLSPSVINVRSKGDVGVARLLRDALSGASNDFEESLKLCRDAQSLAPGYYEPWRVEALVYTQAGDIDAAAAAYDKARELAPESALLSYHYGDFLLNSAGDAHRALRFLQQAARFYPEAYEVLGQIAWSHYTLGDYRDAIVSAGAAAAHRGGRIDDVTAALSIVGRAAAQELNNANDSRLDQAIETLENAIEIIDRHGREALRGEVGDWLILVSDRAEDLAKRAIINSVGPKIPYAAIKGRQYADELRMRVREATGVTRIVGYVVSLQRDRGFGFLSPRHRFFHVYDCIDRSVWEILQEGDICVFTESSASERGPRAEQVRLLR